MLTTTIIIIIVKAPELNNYCMVNFLRTYELIMITIIIINIDY